MRLVPNRKPDCYITIQAGSSVLQLTRYQTPTLNGKTFMLLREHNADFNAVRSDGLCRLKPSPPERPKICLMLEGGTISTKKAPEFVPRDIHPNLVQI